VGKGDRPRLVTLAEFSRRYLDLRGDLAPSTKLKHNRTLRCLSEFLGAPTFVSKITSLDARRFLASYREREYRSRKPATATVNKAVADADLSLVGGNPNIGSEAVVEAVVHNTGVGLTSAATAQFYLGDLGIGAPALGGVVTVEPIAPGGTATIRSAPFVLPEGHTDVCLVVVPIAGETDTGDNRGVLGIDAVNADHTSPVVSGVAASQLRGQDRFGLSVAITFSEAMEPIAVSDLAFTGNVSGAAVPDQVFMTAESRVVTIVFEDQLSDDRYTLTMAGRLTDKAGNPLDGNGDGQGGDDSKVLLTLTRTNLDTDVDVDLADYALFEPCLVGPNAPHGATSTCDQADFDGDDDVDLKDFAGFQRCYSNAGLPADPNCLN